MVSRKFVSAFAALSFLLGVEAGLCKPKTSTSTELTSTVLDSSTATATTVTTESTTLFTTTATSTTTSTEPEVTPALLNGDFDKTPSVSPWEWSVRTDNYPLAIAPGVSHEGGNSLRAKFDDFRLDFLVNKLDPSRLVAGQDYDISAWIQFDKIRDDDGGCASVVLWCLCDGFAFAEKGGNGYIEPEAASIGTFAEITGSCRWSEEQLGKEPYVMIRFQCERTLVFVDSVELVPHGL